MKRLLVGLALASLSSIPRSANADAATDAKDIRNGHLPLRYEMLGWDGGTAWTQLLACSTGGTTVCQSELVAESATRSKRTVLLDAAEVYCGKGEACAAMDTKTVSDFVAAEKKARAAMPTLTKAAAEKDPKTVFGTVRGEATAVRVASRDISPSADDRKIRVELVLTGKDGASERLGVLDAQAMRLNGSKIRDAFVSPDKKTVAFVVETDVGVMCWDFEGLSTVTVDVARKRASLANTIGFRAYKKSDLGAALSGFTEATQLDPTFALGWYNRASIESRNGDAALAKTSFAKATSLDASLAKRACGDADFKTLRAADPGAFRCE